MSRAALLLLFVVACYDVNKAPPVEPDYPPLPPFGGDVYRGCASACSNLRKLGCPEAGAAITNETCERRCVAGMELRSMPLECWSRAEDVAGARACGSLRCLR